MARVSSARIAYPAGLRLGAPTFSGHFGGIQQDGRLTAQLGGDPVTRPVIVQIIGILVGVVAGGFMGGCVSGQGGVLAGAVVGGLLGSLVGTRGH